MKYVHGEKALIIAIGEIAIKDYQFYIKRHNRLLKDKKIKENKRKVFLYHNAKKMKSVEFFFLNDPYDIFQVGIGEKIIKKLRADNKYVPCELISDEEYTELLSEMQ